MPTLTPEDWQEEPRKDWTRGQKLIVAALPVGVGLITLIMWAIWKLTG